MVAAGGGWVGIALQAAMGVFSLVVTVAVGALGYLLKEQWNMLKATNAKVDAVNKELSDHKEEVARSYVPRVDYKSDINRVFDLLDKIKDKLDGKADRAH